MDPIAVSTDFRAVLRAELLRRCRTNPRYSLRSYARALRVEPSALSKLLHGKRGFSPRMLTHLCERLGLGPEEAARFTASPSARRAPASAEPAAYRRLAQDTFEVISHWYHYAILELTAVEGFRPEPRWIARSLGISLAQVIDAVERLERLGLLVRTADGRWLDRSGSITTVGNEFTSVAFRRLQREILEKALLALEELPLEARDQTSMTMAANSALLEPARKKIRKFRRDLCAFLHSKGPLDQVFHLSVSLYPVMQSGQPPKGALH